ncbi:hypothetical protein [Burkholderia gladioli]|uniref:hypothetical protein n=1 Tax=Burkholderia gladioli TaxID=28095 RepID=UPI0028560A80|nr:hypothetical protein [Burkholderia gladioli]MDR8091072.1 hypothetical protein [Burkholderia gladioli]
MPKLDLMRGDRGYVLGRFTALVVHVNTDVDAVAAEARISAVPGAAVRTLTIAYRMALVEIAGRDELRASLIDTRMAAIANKVHAPDLLDPFGLSEQDAFASGFFAELNALWVGGAL